MRPDLPKKFTDDCRNPKYGKFPRHMRKCNKQDEDGPIPIPEGMKKIHKLGGEYKNDGAPVNCSVLGRFLLSRKGRLWNEVHAEICAEADSRSFSGAHLREWLDYMVLQHCRLRESDGVVVDERDIPVLEHWRTFYVHPQTGVLEYVPRKKNYNWKKLSQRVFELDGCLYHKHDDLWYRVEMEELCDSWGREWISNSSSMLRDAFGAVNSFTMSSWNILSKLKWKYGLSSKGRVQICKNKQSANSREIQKLKQKYPEAA